MADKITNRDILNLIANGTSNDTTKEWAKGHLSAIVNLAEAVILLASSPKSNSCAVAIDEAITDLRSRKIAEVPLHLKDAHYKGAKDRGVKGYLYPHDFGGYVKQQYLPDALVDTKYYEYGPNKLEQAAKAYWDAIKK
mgnify:CR=1 FL=1